jgi:hypothetical protein
MFYYDKGRHYTKNNKNNKNAFCKKSWRGF